jgi:succinyl-diaminopimelate desuccinylase
VTDRQIQGATLGLAKALIARRSITPDDDGCLEIVSQRLASIGFVCERIDRGGVANLWATHGSGAPVVCFAGHVDVVPPGPAGQWTSDPFTPIERNGWLVGRGAADMKGSVAAMVTAIERVTAAAPSHRGTIALLLTSDEEGDAADGTVAVVDALRARGQTIDACIVGEPTSVERLGDTIKNGRRGSLSGVLTVRGVQHHIAYPERGRNPIHAALPALAELIATEWDEGNAHFQPTSFQISNVHAGVGAHNVAPAAMDVMFNFRFATASTDDELKARVDEILTRHGLDYDVRWSLSAAPFVTGRGALVDTLTRVVLGVTGTAPQLSTSGGTSDGRFLATIAREVAELGPLNESIHKVDERVAIADLERLSVIYEQTLVSLLEGRSS